MVTTGYRHNGFAVIDTLGYIIVDVMYSEHPQLI